MKPPPMPTIYYGSAATGEWLYARSQIEKRDAQWAALLADAVAAERERLAKRLDELGCDHCASFIRAQTDSKGE